MQIEVVNTTLHPVRGATLSLRSFTVDAQGTRSSEGVCHQLPDLTANSVSVVAHHCDQDKGEGLVFLFLWLQSAAGELISRNCYWLPNKQVGPYSLVVPGAKGVSQSGPLGAGRFQPVDAPYTLQGC